jgi:hypothetical protein
MYLIQNGNKAPVSFGMDSTGESTESNGPVVGDNKMWLYIALIIAIIAVVISGYLIYQQHKKQKNTVGYQLY